MNLSKHHILSWFLILVSCFSFSQEKNLSTLNGKELHSKVRLSVISVNMPFDTFIRPIDEKMHMMGLQYLFSLNNNFYAGAGIHGAILGDQSGFFTLGATLGYNKKLYKNLYFDANIHIGGGGSTSELVNSGLLINPNVGLQYKKNNYSFGVQYSNFNFPTGVINSNSWSVFLEIPSTIRSTNYQNSNKNFSITNLDTNSFWYKPAIKSASQIRFDFLLPFGDSKKDSGESLNNVTLSRLAFEYQKHFKNNSFLFVQTGAIYSGLTAGYMDLFFGYGYNWHTSEYINLHTKLGIGAAGGRIALEGGLTAYPSTGIDIKLSNKLALNANAGYFKFLDGTFEAFTYGFGIKYINYSGGVKNFNEKSFSEAKTSGVTVGIENQRFYGLERRDNTTTNTDQLAGVFSYNINNSFYFVGEASFAYGGDAGGYAHAALGLGYKTPTFLNNKFSAFSEALVGVAGGGRIDTKGGIVIKPSVGLRYLINDKLNLRTSYAYFHAPYGTTRATSLSLGLEYRFSLLNVK